MTERVADAACAGGWDVRRFSTLPSTNDWLMAAARAGAPAWTAAVADHQSQGKGRLGRRWEAPPGRGLLVSVLMRPLAPVESLYACTAAVALAASDACADVAGVAPSLKWPNDLLVGTGKLAGILAESDAAALGGRPGSVAVVVGLGCNVDWDGAPGATCLTAHSDRRVDRDALLDAFLARLGARIGSLDSRDGRHATVGDLRERCVTLGRLVSVQRSGEPDLVGIATRLDDEGHLAVETAAGEVMVAAGDVLHLRGAAPASR